MKLQGNLSEVRQITACGNQTTERPNRNEKGTNPGNQSFFSFDHSSPESQDKPLRKPFIIKGT